MLSLTPSPEGAYPFSSNAVFSNSLSSRLSHLSYLNIEDKGLARLTPLMSPKAI